MAVRTTGGDNRIEPQELRPTGFAYFSPVRFVFLLVGVAAVGALLVPLLWYAGTILLLGFAGIILATFLRGLAERVAGHSPLSYGWALTLVVVVLVTLIGFLCWLLASRIAGQIDQLAVELPRAFGRLERYLEQYRWGQFLIERVHEAGDQVSAHLTLATATSMIRGTFQVGAEILLVVLVGLYGAATPDVYVNGTVRLFPIARRPRVREALKSAGYTLWWWILCRIISMVWVGVATTVGLWLLGVPLALSLGLLAGLLKFVPYLGPWVAFIPAALLALLQGPLTMVYVGALYLALEMIDDHLIMPLLQWGTIWLPPALAIFAQILLGILWGVVGVLFAMPLIAVVLVLVKMLYVEDTLGDPVEVPGQ